MQGVVVSSTVPRWHSVLCTIRTARAARLSTSIGSNRGANTGWDAFETDYTHRDVTDKPSAIIGFEDKTVRHYHGDHSAPEALTKLEDRFDQIVDIQQWIGTPDQRSKLPRRR